MADDRLMSSFLPLETVKRLRRTCKCPVRGQSSSPRLKTITLSFDCSVFPVARDSGMKIDCHAKEKRGERDECKSEIMKCGWRALRRSLVGGWGGEPGLCSC